MAGVSDKSLYGAGPWPLGINNLAHEGALPTDENGKPIALREADNIDLDKEGWPRRRGGYEQIQALSLGHSAWSNPMLPFGLFVSAGELHALHSGDERIEALGIMLGDLAVSYTLLGDRVYFSNRTTCGMLTMDLQGYAWAPPSPSGQPTVAAVEDFALDAGQYQVAITYTDALGRESGSTQATAVEVVANGGVALSNIPQPEDAVATPTINLYLTGPNDQVLKLARSVAAGTTYTVLGSAAQGRSLPVQLQFLHPLPPGKIVRGNSGRQFVAVGNEVLWSESLRYGLYNRADNRSRFSDTVTMVEPVGSADTAGLYVAAGKRTYWLSGADPAQYSQRTAYGHGVVPGTSMIVGGDVLGFDSATPVAVWIATNGQFCAGLPGGQVIPLKQGQAVVDDADRGAILLRQQSGIQQLIATLTAPRRQGLAVSDRAVAHVIHRDA